MNSSISSSERAIARRWARFLRVYLATLLGVGALCYAAVLAIDPYNTGVLTPIDRTIVQTHAAPRFGNVGRARDPQFDSAIFGSSTGQLLEPERLDRLIGGRFVNLIVGGSGPVEQLVTMEYFLRHRAGRARTLVVSMDRAWCEADRQFARDRITHPFPFWIYEDGPLGYASRIVTFETIGLSHSKVMIALGLRKPRARDDGYDNFELGRMWRIDEAWERLRQEGRMRWFSDTDLPTIDSFAAFDALDALVGRLPAETKVALIFTPYFAGALPEPGSATAQRMEHCKARAARLAEARGAAYLDFLQDNAMTREAANFWDPTHYRIHIGRAMENEIAAAVKALPARR
jgi:hypothetical protein